MSLDSIVNYVKNTPGNTNPNVIKTMVEGEMNSTLKAAKDYTDSQRLAYSESLILEFDGNIKDKETINLYNETYVRITDSPIDLNYLSSFCVKTAEGSVLATPKTSTLTEEEYGQGLKFYQTKVILNVQREYDSLKPGIYVWYQRPDTYIERLNFDEILHTIEPKYLPLGCAGSSYKRTFNLFPKTVLDGFETQDLGLGYPVYMLQSSGVWEALHTFFSGRVSGTIYPITLIWDEKIYHTTVTYSYDAVFGSSQYLIGQFDYNDMSNLFEKEPFVCMCDWSDFWITNEDGPHTIEIYAEEEVINQIDPKYAQDILEIAKDYTDGKSIKKEDIIDSFPGGIGYSTFSKVENVLPETTLYSGDNLPRNLNLRQGQNYTVVINGEAVTARAKKVITSMDSDSVVLGNLSLTPYGGKDTGEDFFIGEYYYEAGTYYNKIFLRELSYATIEVYVEEEVIHQIDSKFLPDKEQNDNQLCSLLEEGGFGYSIFEEKEVILPKTFLSHEDDLPTALSLQPGMYCKVLINDNPVITKAKKIFTSMEGESVILGNPSLTPYGGEDSGEDFFIGEYYHNAGTYYNKFLSKDFLTNASVEIYAGFLTIHQIDSKFLPDSSPVLTQETITSLLPGGVGATMPETEENIYPKTVLNAYATDYEDIPTQITLQNGKDYQVIINNKSYIRTAYTVEGNMGIPVVILGNGGLIPSLRGYAGDNGDEFFLGHFIDHSYNEKQAIALKNPVNGLELTVNSVKWVIHTIDKKYLPESSQNNSNGPFCSLLEEGGFGYTEKTSNIIFREQSLDLDQDGYEGEKYGNISNLPSFKPGVTYAITLNGESYILKTVKHFDEYNGNSWRYGLGNAAILPLSSQAEGAGEDFYIGSFVAGGLYDFNGIYFVNRPAEGQFTLEIQEITEGKIHQISPEYIPVKPFTNEDKENLSRSFPGGIGYSTFNQEEIILPETVLSHDQDLLEPLPLQEDMNYIVTINGYSTITKAKRIVTSMDCESVILGNPSLTPYGGENSGEDFFIGEYYYEAGTYYNKFLSRDLLMEATVSIHTGKETVHKISSKYAPDLNTEESIPTFSLLKGPNGKLYQLAIDENGALKVSEGIQTLGRDKFTFTIYGKEYEAEEGMTWYLWCNSSYNPDAFKIVDNEVHYIPWIGEFNPQVLDNWKPVKKYGIIEQKSYDLSP